MAEYSGRHFETGANLAFNNFNVHLFDFRGSGYSQGALLMSTLKNNYEDIVTMFSQINEDLPLYIIGHSLGAGIVVSLLKLNPDIKISGVFLTSPLLKFPDELKVSTFDKFMVKMIPEKF